MKIACFQIEPWQELILKEKLKNNILITFPEPLSQESIQEAKEAGILMIRARGQDLSLNGDIISQFPHLRFIATMSTGFDHIDLEACRKGKILISNVPSYGEDTVAEYTFALLLAVSRKILYAYKEQNLLESDIEGVDLKGRIFGIIGSGRIGLKVIALAKAFGMEVLAYDIIENQEASRRLGFKYVQLEDLLKKSDIISLHAPLTQQTKHIINKNNIIFIKKGAVLINAARGGLVDTKALLKGLDEGIIESAGLDVIDKEKESASFDEQLPEVQKLIKHPKVIVTPHNAWNTREAKHRMMQTTVENILAFIKGSPQNLI